MGGWLGLQVVMRAGRPCALAGHPGAGAGDQRALRAIRGAQGTRARGCGCDPTFSPHSLQTRLGHGMGPAGQPLLTSAPFEGPRLPEQASVPCVSLARTSGTCAFHSQQRPRGLLHRPLPGCPGEWLGPVVFVFTHGQNPAWGTPERASGRVRPACSPACLPGAALGRQASLRGLS